MISQIKMQKIIMLYENINSLTHYIDSNDINEFEKSTVRSRIIILQDKLDLLQNTLL